MGYDYDWDWDWLFVQHFARKMKDLGYSPWYVGSRLAEVYSFIQKYKHDDKVEPQSSNQIMNEEKFPHTQLML